MRIGDYIYRIAPRPRDVIAFFNTCIGAAADHPRLANKELRLAEGEYSRGRLRALADEWSSDYPTLVEFSKILQKRPTTFKAKTIADASIEELCLEVAAEHPKGMGQLQAMQVVDLLLPARAFKFMLIGCFYQVGLVGLKLAGHARESWSDELGRGVSFPEIGDETSVVIHPAYRRVLGVDDA